MRAVVLGSDGEPSLADIVEPPPPGELVNVRACGLCGSDVEKIGIAAAGTVLGHEVVASTADGRRVALIHHDIQWITKADYTPCHRHCICPQDRSRDVRIRQSIPQPWV